MPITNIEAHRQRVLAVPCPVCHAAPTSLCYEDYFNASGKGSKHTNIFHVERIAKAQTMAERAMDLAIGIRTYLNNKTRA